MKKMALVLALTLSSTIASARSFSEHTLAESTVQTVAVAIANTVAAVSQASTVATSENRKLEAQIIQNHIQEYTQSGEVSAYLASKIEFVQSVDAELSTEESIDVLIAATDLILK